MDNILYNMLKSYYDILEVTGYLKGAIPNKLLVYSFYRDFVMNDYRGILTKDDYRLIEQVLDCFYGTECLMSYPDYLKMGKLHCGEITELAHRVKKIEDTEVVKVIHDIDEIASNPQSDVQIIVEED